MKALGEDFERLQALWYAKLKKTGFRDIEDTSHPLRPLKVWDSLWFITNYPGPSFEEKQKYYEGMAEFFWRHEFKDEVEKEIWRLHAEGLSRQKIVKIINQGRRKKIKECSIQLTLSRLKKIMKSQM